MIRCNNCGEVFEDDEVEVVAENVGEFWGSPAYMNVDVCPHCGSDELEEVEEEEEEEADE